MDTGHVLLKNWSPKTEIDRLSEQSTTISADTGTQDTEFIGELLFGFGFDWHRLKASEQLFAVAFD